MSVVVTIQGTPIEFPTTGESPNWAPAIVEFAQATQEALEVSVAPGDISSRVVVLTSEINALVPITGLSFSSGTVRAAVVSYSVIRISDTQTKAESGNILVLYNDTGWSISRDYFGDADCTFNISPGGQLLITTPAIGGTYSSGSISFSAKALKQTN